MFVPSMICLRNGGRGESSTMDSLQHSLHSHNTNLTESPHCCPLISEHSCRRIHHVCARLIRFAQCVRFSSFGVISCTRISSSHTHHFVHTQTLSRIKFPTGTNCSGNLWSLMLDGFTHVRAIDDLLAQWWLWRELYMDFSVLCTHYSP